MHKLELEFDFWLVIITRVIMESTMRNNGAGANGDLGTASQFSLMSGRDVCDPLWNHSFAYSNEQVMFASYLRS